MSDTYAFNPLGPTGRFTAAVAGSVPAPIRVVGQPAATTYRIFNNGTVTAFVAFGVTPEEATANAVIPTGGDNSAKRAIPIPTLGSIIIRAPKDDTPCWWTGITGSSTADIYITPGVGKQ